MNATNANQTSLQAEQKAHEPSMEDILASIRKIIADDDALPLSRRATSARPSAPKPEPVAVEPENAPVAPPPSTQRIPAPPPVQPPFAPADRLLKPPPIPNLRDLALRLDSIPLRSAPQVELTAAPELRPSFDDAPDEVRAFDAEPAEDPAATAPVVPAVLPDSEPVPAKTSVGFATAGFQVPPLAFQASVAAPLVSVAPVAVAAAVEAKAAAVEVTPAQVQAKAPAGGGSLTARIGLPAARLDGPEPAMLSENSGLKVSAAFEALAESALLRDPEMVERLTREILRPMIKTWLDDNLPNVVERLVRAEIERVARGPRG